MEVDDPNSSRNYSSRVDQPEDLPFVAGKVDDLPVRLLLDSGSQMTIVHRRVVSRPISPTTVILRGITGQGLALAGEAQLDLTIG